MIFNKNILYTIVFILSANFLYSQGFPDFNKAREKGIELEKILNDTTKVKLPFPTVKSNSNLHLKSPLGIKPSFDYNSKSYLISKKIGDYNITHPILMNRKDYSKYILRQQITNHFLKKSREVDDFKRAIKNKENKLKSDRKSDNLLPNFAIKSKLFETIFGGNEIKFIPKGSASVDLAAEFQTIDNPLINKANRSTFNIDFDQNIQLSLQALIGKNFSFKANYDTKSTFTFENELKLRLKGDEDDILKTLEVGNVTMPIQNSLIHGSQSLFGAKTKLQFGKTFVTAVYSQQKSNTRTINTVGGSALNKFDIQASDYQENTNFFLAHYFRDNYDKWTQNYPNINSGINITRVEVWVANTSNSFENNRNIVSFVDLGENSKITTSSITPSSSILPDFDLKNTSENSNNINTFVNNNLRDKSLSYRELQQKGMFSGRDFSLIENARKLAPDEFYINQKLGYISLNSELEEDQVLAVSFEYQKGGKIYRVGEFYDEIDSPKNIIAKTLKTDIINVGTPIWDLMMKNIYSLNAGGISYDDFKLDILYKDNTKGSKVNYLANSGNLKETILLQLFGFDRLRNNNLGEDGRFDFQEGITIDSQKGRIIFTKKEPFGKYLRERLISAGASQKDIDSYVFEDLYSSTKENALGKNSSKNKFSITGQFKSNSTQQNGLFVGATNIPKGSVKVTSGGKKLREGVDYVVNYKLGKVEIINDIYKSSNTPVQISLEDNTSNSFDEKKRFLGLDVQHKFNDNLSIGGSVVNYREKSTRLRSNYGQEPVNNTLFGLNASYSAKAPFLTRMVNKLPFIDSEQESNVRVLGEFAYLKPGASSRTSGEATSYIDDFENSQSKISVMDASDWKLGSNPGGNGQSEFDGNKSGLEYGYNRAKLSWYHIDPVFYGVGEGKPSNITKSDLSKNNVREVDFNEIFSERDNLTGSGNTINTFDISFFPKERGAYNYDPAAVSGTDPNKSWASIIRPIFTSNFEKANVDYIEFWVMDPFSGNNSTGGDVFLQLGNISEDILKDGQKQYENGLVDDNGNPNFSNTIWGKIPNKQSTIYAFNNDVDRNLQDVGLDGLSDLEEVKLFGNAFGNDPSADNFKYFINGDYDAANASIIERYKNYNSSQGNSPNNFQSSTVIPDTEDINNDQIMTQNESYFQYKLSFRPNDLQSSSIGKNYLSKIKEVSVNLADGTRKKVKWFQFKIPVKSGTSIGGISSFRSIRFMRLALKNFTENTTLRFATLDLVRSDWRRFTENLKIDNSGLDDISGANTNIANFEVSSVNFLENSTQKPVPYLLPPGIEREETYSNFESQSQDEQSLLMKVTKLDKNDSRAVYKFTDIDLRRYKKLKMYVHAHKLQITDNLNDDDISVFVRIGDDMTDNYYEYEVPLKLTGHNTNLAQDIWKDKNNINIISQELIDLKVQRDSNIKNGSINSISDRFKSVNKDGKTIWVKGRPSTNNIKVIMLGVRNNSKDGLGKSVEIWLNELRASGFDNEGGWASRATVDVNLSDFANVSLSGSMSTTGFGGVEQNYIDRSFDDIKQYELNTSMNLGMLTPKKWGLKVPFNYSISESFIDPKYNPLDKDVKVESLDADTKKEVLDKGRDYTKRKSISFLNVRKEYTNPKKKRKFYDVENLSASYSYSEMFNRNITTTHRINKNVRAWIDYSYGFKPKYLEPFKKLIKTPDTSAWHKITSPIKQFNLNLKPRRISFSVGVDRDYNQELYRDLDLTKGSISAKPYFGYNFKFNYKYNIGFDLTRSLKMDFTSTTNRDVKNIAPSSFINGVLKPVADRDLVFSDFFNIGNPYHYNQNFRLNWKTPLHLLPYLDWTNLDLNYNASYDWASRSDVFVNAQNDYLGNTIQNNNSLTWSGNLNFEKLYDKFSYLRILRQKTELIGKKKIALKDSKGNNISSKMKAKDYAYMLLTSVKSINFNLNKSSGTVLPGFKNNVNFFGRSSSKPTLGFTFGSQTDILQKALLNGWVVDSDALNEPYKRVHTDNFDYSILLEPIPDLKINLDANRTFSRNTSINDFNVLGSKLIENESGNFNMTYFTLRSSFSDPDKIFNTFRKNTLTIANRLARDKGITAINPKTGFPTGYSSTSQDVVIPAFLSAYSGKSSKDISTSPFRNIPIPNWNLTYTGFIKNKWVKKRFENFDFKHSYRSAYSINNFVSNLEYQSEVNSGNAKPTNSEGNLLSKTSFGAINIAESFSPLIGFDARMKNGMEFSFDYNRDRTLSYSIYNSSLTEIIGSEFVFGMGYVLRDLKLKMMLGGRRRTFVGDLNFKADLSIRDNITTIRKLLEGDNTITGGQKLISIKGQVDYDFTKMLNFRVFYDHNITKNKISTIYPVSNIRFGVSALFKFGY